MTQRQVDGMNAILDLGSRKPRSQRPCVGSRIRSPRRRTRLASPCGRSRSTARARACPTASDPETGQTYYGRGFVQLTWRGQLRPRRRGAGLRHTRKTSTVWSGTLAMPSISMSPQRLCFRGWMRAGSGAIAGPHNLDRWFNDQVDDSYMAREIINGDKHIIRAGRAASRSVT